MTVLQPIPISNPAITFKDLNPYNIDEPIMDYRVFGYRLGAYVGTDLLYTVPSGYDFYITHIFRPAQSGSAGETLEIWNASGSGRIWMVISDGTAAGYQEGRNMIDSLKLIPGDYIIATYNLGGGQYCSWMVQGYLKKRTAQQSL